VGASTPDGGDDVNGQRPRVVIVGAGFGGLTVAKRLAKTPADITLIDRQNHLCPGSMRRHRHLARCTRHATHDTRHAA